MAASRSIGWMMVLAGCAHAPPPAPDPIRVQNQIVTKDAEYSERQLFEIGERALAEQAWPTAANAFETLLKTPLRADRNVAALFDVALAYDGLVQREQARDKYREVIAKYPASPEVRVALVRLIPLLAYFEDWEALQETSEQLLRRTDLSAIDSISGFGGLGLAKIERGDDVGAMRAVLEGLDKADEIHYGATGRLPVPVVLLRFSLAEVRRVRSERITFVPIGRDFPLKIEARAQGLLDAQTTYADAIRSVDPHWAAISGYRIGEMYQAMHRDLMAIPPIDTVKSEKDQQVFYGIMHLRYRTLLEKGIEMTNRTIALATKTADTSAWIHRAEVAKAEMEQSLEDEKRILAAFPFTEKEIERALQIMEDHTKKH